MKKTKTPKDKRKILIRALCVFLCLLMLLPLLVNAFMASAASSKEIKKELDALQSQADEIEAQGKELESQLSKNETSTQSTIEQKMAIDLRISQTETEIRNVNEQIQQYSLLISAKQSELEDSQEELEAMNVKYRARLRAMEESGKVSYWSILFKASSFSDLLSRIDSIHEVAEADNRMLAEMQAIVAPLEVGKPEQDYSCLRSLYSRADVFGLDLYEAGLGEQIEGMVKELFAGPGAVRATLHKYVTAR